jgi:hypothetical protein
MLASFFAIDAIRISISLIQMFMQFLIENILFKEKHEEYLYLLKNNITVKISVEQSINDIHILSIAYGSWYGSVLADTVGCNLK